MNSLNSPHTGLGRIVGLSAALAMCLYTQPIAARSLAGTGPGTIESLSPAIATRSGYVEILGTNFGSSGEVLVDGLPALTSTWSPGRVVFYVPEGARVMAVPVVLYNPSGEASNSVSLVVNLRVTSGRILWRFRMDAPYSLVRPAIAADGTIYAVDVSGHLYALAPDGALEWLANGAGDKGVAVAPDGTVVVSSETDVRSFHPDGSPGWIHTQVPRALIDLGVAVGPDANVYSVGTEGPGVFSLELDGTPRWATPESYSRPITDYGELVFGPNGSARQLYFYANNHLRALGLDGSSVFTLVGAFGQPAVGPDGSVHGALAAFTPGGSLLWSFASPYPYNVFSAPDVGSDGTHYVTQNLGELFAFNTAGAVKWHVTLNSGIGGPMVDPTNALLVAGGEQTLDFPGLLHGFSTANGGRLWTVTLPAEDPTVFNPGTGQYGYNQDVFTRGRFSNPGTAAYFMTGTATGNNATSRAFLYAVDVGPQAALDFYSLPPCRLLDTREAGGPAGGPALSPAAPRSFPAANRCGIPATAKALSLNATVVAASSAGELRLFPDGMQPTPGSSVLFFRAGQARANSVVLKLDESGLGSFAADVSMASGSVHLIVDVNGYYQ